MTPSMVDAMTDYSPEERATGRNFLARHLPESMHVGAIGTAREMATVPGRNPMFADPQPIDPRVAYDQQLTGMVHNAPRNALSIAGEQPDEFGQALNEFLAEMRTLQEMAP